MNEAGGRLVEANVADDLMNSLAFFIRHDHHDAKTEALFLSFIYRFLLAGNFTCWLRSSGNDVGKMVGVFESRDTDLHFI